MFHEFLGQSAPTNAVKTYTGSFTAATSDTSGNVYLVAKHDSNSALPSYKTLTSTSLMKLNTSGQILNGSTFNPPAAMLTLDYYDVSYDKTNDRICLYIGAANSVVISGQTYYALIELNSNGTLHAGLTSNSLNSYFVAAGAHWSLTAPKQCYYAAGQLYTKGKGVNGFYSSDYFPINLATNTLTTTSSLVRNLDIVPSGHNAVAYGAALVYKQDVSSECVSGLISYGDGGSINQVFTAIGIATVKSNVFSSNTVTNARMTCQTNAEVEVIGTGYPYASGAFDNNNTVLRMDLTTLGANGSYTFNSDVGNSTGAGAAFNYTYPNGYWYTNYYGDCCKLSDNSAVYYSSSTSGTVTYKGVTVPIVATNTIVKIDSGGNIATWNLPSNFAYVSTSNCISTNDICITMYRKYNDHILFMACGNTSATGYANFMFETDSSGNVIWA